MPNTRYRTTIYDILDAMDRYGGSFVRQLATLHRTADAVNKKRVEESFRDYFIKYDDMAVDSAALKEKDKK